jgi:hypothetical protein
MTIDIEVAAVTPRVGFDRRVLQAVVPAARISETPAADELE